MNAKFRALFWVLVSDLLEAAIKAGNREAWTRRLLPFLENAHAIWSLGGVLTLSLAFVHHGRSFSKEVPR